jgi:hypothetical protein
MHDDWLQAISETSSPVDSSCKREVTPFQLGINYQYKRVILSNFNVKIEPLGKFVVTSRNNQSVPVLRMWNIAKVHFVQKTPQCLGCEGLLLEAACPWRKNNDQQN